MKLKLLLPIALLSSLSLISCGGGGGDTDEILSYSGVISAARVSTENAGDLAVAATAGAGQAVAEDLAQGVALRPSPSPEKAFILDFAERLKHQFTTSNRSENRDTSVDYCSSGSADVTANDAGTEITIIFNNCVVIEGDGEKINGKIIMITDDTFSYFSMQFINFTVTIYGETYTMNMTISCDDLGCNWTSDFTGLDGRIYRTQNAEVYFDGNSYYVTATVYDPDFGFFEIDGSVQIGNCSNGVPFPGSISITDSEGNSGSVTYDSCDLFTVTVNGVSTTNNWADIL